MNVVPVCVVDDDPAARESLVAFLHARGYAASAYSSGESFLSELNPSASCCVITDLKMPGMSGLELQDELLRRGHHLPVIVVSGFADVPMTVRVMRNGAVTLLEKPYDDRALAAALDEAIAKVRQRHQRSDRARETRGRLENLSAEERDVMDRLLRGHSNKMIAEALEVGLRTVERRRHMILDKIGVASLPELARLIAEMEFLDVAAEPSGPRR